MPSSPGDIDQYNPLYAIPASHGGAWEESAREPHKTEVRRAPVKT
jgi:hypothetical protein